MGSVGSREMVRNDRGMKVRSYRGVYEGEDVVDMYKKGVSTIPITSRDMDYMVPKMKGVHRQSEPIRLKKWSNGISLLSNSIFRKNSRNDNQKLEKIDPEFKNLHTKIQDHTHFPSTLSKSNFILQQYTHHLDDEYILHNDKIGQGTFGSVSQAINKQTGAICAIKTVAKNQLKNLDRLRTEISIMKELDHPNIIKLYETYEDYKNIYLVMELCRGGELFDLIIEKGYFTEKSAAIIMKQIFSSLNYMHSQGVMHRDLKPENFLFLNKNEENSLKIIDFGLSCRFKPGTVCKTKAGTPYYVDPQVLKGHYDYACDYWSSGVIMYLLLCGYPPFSGETDAEVLKKVRLGNFYFSGFEWKKISSESKDLIKRLLKLNPKERYTAEMALQHPWIVKMAQLDALSLDPPPNLIENIKSFNTINKLKKAALTVIALHASQKEVNTLKEVFFNLDTDNNGKLSINEIKEGLKRFSIKDSDFDVQQVLVSLDLNRSGTIDYTEFLAATIDQQTYKNELACRDAFRVFDMDRDGRIERSELRAILGFKEMSPLVDRILDNLLTEVDLNGDGVIDFDEFLMMMRKNPDNLISAIT